MRRLRRPSFIGLATAALSGAVAVWYVVLIGEGVVYTRDAEGYVAGVVVVLFGQAALSLVAALRRSITLLVVAALLLTATGVLALFSIGAPLLLAGALAGAAAVWTRVRTPR